MQQKQQMCLLGVGYNREWTYIGHQPMSLWLVIQGNCEINKQNYIIMVITQLKCGLQVKVFWQNVHISFNFKR
jgi:hypothetical protein